MKQITQRERDLLEKHGYLQNNKRVYIASARKRSKGKTYYTLDQLAEIVKTLK